MDSLRYWWVVPCTLLLLFTLGCSSDDDDMTADPADTSEFNPDLETPDTAGEPGGDTSAIAGLWDGSIAVGEATDTVYWNLADNGVLTRYDFQGDGIDGASGENCYLVGDDITVTPEADDDYSIANVAVTIVRSDDTLTITFVEEDANDLNANGDTSETPTLSWALLTTPTLADLNSCE